MQINQIKTQGRVKKRHQNNTRKPEEDISSTAAHFKKMGLPILTPPEKNEVEVLPREKIKYKGHVPMYIFDRPAGFEFDRGQLIEILKKEDQIRKSPEIQERYTKMKVIQEPGEESEPVMIDRSCQVLALQNFGYEPEKDESLKAYQIACGRHMRDPEVKVEYVFCQIDTNQRKGVCCLDEVR
jgi:hypothetical protein